MTPRAALLAVLLVAPAAHGAADPADPPPAAPCVVKGNLVESATVFDAAGAKFGQPIATITGNNRWVQVSEFRPHAQRLRLVSGKSAPTLRVEGYVDVASMPIGLAKDVPIAGNALVLRATVPLRIAENGPLLNAEPRTPTFASTAATIACGDLQVTKAKAPSQLPPASQSLTTIHKSFELFAAAHGEPVATLHSIAPNVTFRAYETMNGMVHVRFAADVVIDGWMKRSELASNLVGYGVAGCGGMGLGTWGTSSSPSFAQRDSEVRLGGAQGAHVGVLEKGARVARWGVGSGAWSRIRVYDADLTEPEGKLFYVRESDLGATAP